MLASKLYILVLCTLIHSCISKYDFNVDNTLDSIIIVGTITDKSYTETKLYPSDGRFFSIKLSKGSNVDNVKDELIENANVKLLSDKNESWDYTYSAIKEAYLLINEDFKAQVGTKYKLKITLANNNVIESNFEELPNANPVPIGPIVLEEEEKKAYQYTNTGREIVTEKGVTLKTTIQAETPAFYKWNFETFWTYYAGLVPITSPIRKCWINEPNANTNITLFSSLIKGINVDLFFLKVKDNQRLDDYFSTLIIQEELSEEHFQYWADLEAQKDKGGLYDNPPFNLTSNLNVITGNISVQGYFAVANENAKWWIFNRDEISYPVATDYQAYLCETTRLDIDLPPLGQCRDCRNYYSGESNNYPPNWWTDK